MKKTFAVSLLGAIALASCNTPQPASSAADTAHRDSVVAIAKEAFVYGLPLALMDITRKKLTNFETPGPGNGAPINQFSISSAFPDAKFRDVVRPNADTYYATAMLDLSAEPLIYTIPATGSRYYLMPMLDAYTNIFESPGLRTGFTKGGNFLITGPKWSGTVPDKMKQIKAPTNLVWILGRFEVKNPQDGTSVIVPLEKKLNLVPLSAFGKPYSAPKGTINSSLSKADPNQQAFGMPIDEFFNNLNTLMVADPPSAADQPALAKFTSIGVGPGAKFDMSTFDTATQAALKEVPKMINEEIQAALAKGIVNQ